MLEENEDKRNDGILDCHRIYAKRHKLNPVLVARNEWSDLAAVLEFQVGTRQLSVPDARRMFVERYPSSNVPYWYKESVINIIKAYDDSIRKVSSLRERPYKEIIYESESNC